MVRDNGSTEGQPDFLTIQFATVSLELVPRLISMLHYLCLQVLMSWERQCPKNWTQMTHWHINKTSSLHFRLQHAPGPSTRGCFQHLMDWQLLVMRDLVSLLLLAFWLLGGVSLDESLPLVSLHFIYVVVSVHFILSPAQHLQSTNHQLHQTTPPAFLSFYTKNESVWILIAFCFVILHFGIIFLL